MLFSGFRHTADEALSLGLWYCNDPRQLRYLKKGMILTQVNDSIMFGASAAEVKEFVQEAPRPAALRFVPRSCALAEMKVQAAFAYYSQHGTISPRASRLTELNGHEDEDAELARAVSKKEYARTVRA